jgi:hydroxypyruvate reductase
VSTYAQAREILHRYGISQPQAAIAALERAEEETPKPGDPRLAGNEVHVIAAARKSIEAAAAVTQPALGDMFAENPVEPLTIATPLAVNAKTL